MQLQFAEKKISTCEGHISQLRQRIAKLEADLDNSSKVGRADIEMYVGEISEVIIEIVKSWI